MGLLVGTTFYPVISTTKRHRFIMWFFRIIAIPLTVVLFIVLIRNFYSSNPYAGKIISPSLSSPFISHDQRALGVDTYHAFLLQRITIVKGMLSSLLLQPWF